MDRASSGPRYRTLLTMSLDRASVASTDRSGTAASVPWLYLEGRQALCSSTRRGAVGRALRHRYRDSGLRKWEAIQSVLSPACDRHDVVAVQ